jgi:raffinose/stachyose/melibiose transport system substrate-binding protein
MLDTALSRRKALLIGAAAAGLTLLPARRASAQDKMITFWNLAGIYDVEDPNDKTKKPEDFYISQAIGRFEAANPGLKVQMESLPSDTSAFTKCRTASVAKNGPDIMGAINL